MRISVVLLSLACVLGVTAPAVEWVEDLDQAKATAEKEGKDLLLDFTGSDWCSWCMKLHKEVFEKEKFTSEAPKQFVLVEVDFPKGKPQLQKIKKQNEELSEKFAIEGYPTIILLDSKGRSYAQTGYKAGGPDAYLDHLAKLREVKATRDKMFAAAQAESGPRQSQMFDEALTEVGKHCNPVGYEDIMQKIIDGDPDNKAGLKAKYESGKLMDGVNAKFAEKDYDGALALIEKFMKDYPTLAPVIKQKVYYMKAGLLNFKKDEAGTLAALETARDADPNTEYGKKIAEVIDDLKNSKAEAAKKDSAKSPEKK